MVQKEDSTNERMQVTVVFIGETFQTTTNKHEHTNMK